MTQKRDQLVKQVRLYALEAVTNSERWSKEEYILHGAVMLTNDKHTKAVEFTIQAYQEAIVRIPALVIHDLDHNDITRAAHEGVNWAFEQIAEAVNIGSDWQPIDVQESNGSS